MIVIDDQLLFEVLAGSKQRELRDLMVDGVATTFSSYDRLSRTFATGRIDRALSRRFAALNEERRRHTQGLLEELPDAVTLLQPRELVPVMSALAARTSVNFLTAEALGTSMILEAPVAVSTTSTLLANAAARAGVEVVVLTGD